jgi:hypothetical protein
MRRSCLAVFAVLAGALAFGCSDRDQDTDPGPKTGTPAQTATPTPTVTPTPVPGRAEAEAIAETPAHFIYVVGPGDTLASIADMFDGIVGGSDAAFAEEIRTLNGLTGDSLPLKYEIAIPLRLSVPGSLFQSNSVDEALRAGATEEVTPFQVPAERTIDGMRGLVALYRVEIEDGNAPAEGRGYYMVYSQTDRVAIKGTDLDREARNLEPAFVVAGGSLGERLLAEHPDSFFWKDHPFVYYIYVLADGLPHAGVLAAGFRPQ